VDDVLPYPEFSPWLGSVIVRADRRGAGLGTQIVRETMLRAGAMGIRTLHLWTPDHRHFYERLAGIWSGRKISKANVSQFCAFRSRKILLSLVLCSF